MSLQSSWLQFAAMFVLVRDLVIKAYNILQANVFPCSQQFNHHSQWTKYSVRRAWRRTLTVAKWVTNREHLVEKDQNFGSTAVIPSKNSKQQS